MIPVIETDAQAYASARPLPELSGDQAQDVVSIARSQLGYSEGGDGGTVYGAWWGKVTSWGDYTYASWCAMFACWCANQAGAGQGVAYDRDCAVVQNFMNWLKRNGKTDTSFSSTPRPGDFIFFGYGSTPSHVAIVEKYDVDTNVVTFIGGNQSDQVKRCTVSWSRSGLYGSQNVVGYGRPNYNTGSQSDPQPNPQPEPKPETPIVSLEKPAVCVDKSKYLKGDDVTVSWKAVPNSTGYTVAVYQDGELLNRKSVEGTCFYKIKSVTAGSYQVKVTASNGTCSETGSCSFKVTDVQPAIRLWLSQSQMGEPTEEYKIGNSYYLCYEIYDQISGKPLDDVKRYDHSVKLTVTAPDGEEVLTGTYDDDSGSDCLFVDKTGEYIFKAETSGDITVSGELSRTAEEDPKKILVSEDIVVLSQGTSAASATVYVWTTGYIDSAAVLAWQGDNTNVSCAWGDQLEDGRHPLVITADAAGITVITLVSKASGTGEVLDSVTITVTVDVETFTVSFDANGGTGVPEDQLKPKGVDLVLSSGKPEREGFIFFGWATAADAVTAEYQPGTSFLVDADTKLYAIWSQTFLSGDANEDGCVNMKDWNCLYEYSNEVAELTDDSLFLADVNDDGKVNMKDWTRLYEHICETDPLW